MFVAHGKLGYDWKKIAEALAPDAYRELRRKVESFVKLPESQEGLKAIQDFTLTYNASIIDDRTVAAFNDAGIEVTLSHVRGLGAGGGDVQNTIYQVCIPDIGLLHIKNVDSLYNCDERTINDHLDKGWRILAIMPPRVTSTDEYPTYVIGDTKDPNLRP